MNRLSCSIFIIVFLFGLPTVLIGVASITIGYQNINTKCDVEQNNLIKLSTWLFINSCFSFASIFLYILFTILFLKKEQYKYLLCLIVFYIINFIFIISWNVFGTIELIIYSENCFKESLNLWIIVLVSLIMQWFSIICISVTSKYDCSKKIEKNIVIEDV